jgi:uridylate kinase
MPHGYGRALLKISGEALAGEGGFGLNHEDASRTAAQIAQASREGRQLGVVIGAGNILRGVDAASVGVPRLVADEMGMIATVINALALRAALESAGAKARAMSAFPVGRFIEIFEREKAHDYLEQGYVVVFAGGTGNPCFTTDSAAALRAVEIQADVLVKGTQVAGVFDRDPREHADASFFETISPAEYLKRGLRVLDAACVDILAKNGIPAIVLDMHVHGNILKALNGEKVGSTIR